MAKFNVTLSHPVTQERKKVVYDSHYSTLVWENGEPVIETKLDLSDKKQVKIQTGKNPKTVKIQLGLSCNYECEYCNQRFVPHADSTNPDDIAEFISNMDSWFDGGDDKLGSNRWFEFWGGEPFVYWKTMKPLAEQIRKKYPNSGFSIITNGSLLDKEKVDWLDSLGFSVGISHDGPGQFVRGPDPFDDVGSKEGILYAYKTLAPKGRLSFNSMVTAKNISRAGVQKFFETLIVSELGEHYLQYLTIGEGTFIDAYDEGGLSSSLENVEQEMAFRKFSFDEIRAGYVTRYGTIQTKVDSFIKSITNGKRSEDLNQKCGMDLSDNMAIDLKGNVLTCQNVSTVSTNPSGIAHHLGNVSDLSSVEVKTGTHWSDREACPNCPVLHICKGACFFLTGPLWETTCNNAYSDNIVVFCCSIEILTGMIPIHIEDENKAMPQDRKDIFGMVYGIPKTTKKIIPIKSL